MKMDSETERRIAVYDRHYQFKPHFPYRTCGLDDPKINRKTVIFMGWRAIPGDIVRAVVRMMMPDGASDPNCEWFVDPRYVIKIP